MRWSIAPTPIARAYQLQDGGLFLGLPARPTLAWWAAVQRITQMTTTSTGTPTGTPTGSEGPVPPRHTANPSPPRPAGSVRRTTSIDVEWPDGIQGERIMHGRARDILSPTGATDDATVLAEARMEARVSDDRTITGLAASPAPAGLSGLVGQRGGNHLRMVMGELIPELIADSDPLYLLLDDISGVSLISNWGWSLWQPNWMETLDSAMRGDKLKDFLAARVNVCWGFQPGHSSLALDRLTMPSNSVDGGELRNPADPGGWHEFPATGKVSMRRARRIDVWRETDSDIIHIDSAFQDSAPRPVGTRAALHEYRLSATLEPDTLRLLSLDIDPRVLPFHECPGAITNAKKLIGTPLADIRAAVLAQLRGPAGCTNLNDALRALGEVPALVKQLPA